MAGEAAIRQNRDAYRLVSACLLFLSLLFVSGISSARESVVLVAGESSKVQKVSGLEIRRIYLGLPPSADSQIKKPVINLSDRKLYRAFLKNVMHMTERGYSRKIVKRIFRQGADKLREIRKAEQLIRYLKENPGDVSFMSRDMAEKTEGIKVVQVLW